ncbi:MAG: AraC family transcriptional regulator [Clostridia bacterium]|jgi:AraC-like DNA-binding protein|nr:AraC family transcriptional regulator [Clostridia bacterium]
MKLYKANADTNLIVRYMGHVTYNSPWTHFSRIADEYILYVLLSGTLYIKEANQYFTLKKGDVFLLDPFVEHTGFKASCCDYYFVHFRFEGLHPLPSDFHTTLQDILQISRQHVQQSSLYDDAVYTNSDTMPLYLPKCYEPQCYAILLSLLEAANSNFYQKYENYRKIASLKIKEMLIHMARDYADYLLSCQNPAPTKTLGRAMEAKTFLDAHYTQKITSKTLTDIFDVNYNYLNRTFSALTGFTLIDYLNRSRIEHAKELIASSSHLSFSNIAYLVGIDNPYYFSKLFKKYTGITATEYAYTISFKEYK